MDLEEILDRTRLPPRAFFAQSSEALARDLLGTTLLHRTNKGPLAGTIVEVEAYLGKGDPAAHSSVGKTRRTRAIFGLPGHAYVYRIYGLHRCFNVVAEPDGVPGCVLVRAIQPTCGSSTMQVTRRARQRVDIASGPGKLTVAMAIGMELYGADLLASPLTIRVPKQAARPAIGTSPRIGIRKARDLQLRFFVKNSPYVSR